MSMRSAFKVIGVSVLARKLTKAGERAPQELDALVENSMKRVQKGAFDRGPVLTGFLTSNLIADENRVRTPGKPLHSFDLLDGTHYTFIQEYTNPRSPGFIRNSVIKEEQQLPKDINRFYKKGGWKL